jgi:hypothetical protein
MRHIDRLQDAIRAKNGWLPAPVAPFVGINRPRSTPDNRPNCDSNHSLSFGPNVRVGPTKSEGLVSSMQSLTRECDRTACSLACQLIDKLTVIVGNCDLLREEMEAGLAARGASSDS